MNNISDFLKCCGCGVCEAVCPKEAIILKKDFRGVFLPHVNENVCVECGLCKQTCDFNKENNELEPIQYVGLKASDDIRDSSQSGGAFFLLASKFMDAFKLNASVYGVCLSGPDEVKHIRITKKEDLKLLQKSKYAKSNFGDTFANVSTDLNNGFNVMFSGTPCQVAALYSFLNFRNVNISKLITVDIICHGTPPNQFWKEYVSFIEDRYCKHVKEANFRDKAYGWSSHFETFVFTDNTKIKTTKYRDLFYSYHSLEAGCFDCKYASYKRYSDLTIGDLWGNQSRLINFKDKKGVSLVLVNTDKGKNIFNSILDFCEVVHLEKNETKQPNLLHPSIRPKNYDKFWSYYKKNGFNKTIIKYVDRNYWKKFCDFKDRIKNKFKRMFLNKN